MRLVEALSIVAKAPAHAKPLPVLLACGFTPLHLQNYLAAHLQRSNPDRKVSIETGLFDDVAGTVAKFSAAETGMAVLALEWADLDPRLGYRQAGGWGQRIVAGLLSNVNARLDQLERTIGALSSSSRLVISLPTLDLPPAFHTVGWQSSEAEIALHHLVAGFASRIVAHPSVFLLSQQRLAIASPQSGRYDFRSDLNTGFPYSQAHAEALAVGYTELLQPKPPKKGLITDLDDTLWRGLVGEVGSAEVSWDLSSHSQMHGLYQQSLKALAEQGVLLAISSKNSEAVVAEALLRDDLILDRNLVFPLEVHWEPKSGSVGRILHTWNISADAVVFVDDSPMELAEVKAKYPEIECLLFPKSDYAAGLALLRQLRDLFGKPRLSEEDSYRLQSIRQAQQFSSLRSSTEASDLLASAEAVLTFELMTNASDKRVLELVNKTNQFNLNGKRFSESEWHDAMMQPGAFLLAISYEDKFGPLGKIAAVQGRTTESKILVETWIMSCRAFSRQIEHQTLAQIFERFTAQTLVFDFTATPKNGPLQEFLSALTGQDPQPGFRLQRDTFQEKCPQLYHEIKWKQ